MPSDKRTLGNVPAEEIRRLMNNSEVAKAYRQARAPIRKCPVCEAAFTENRRWQKFCTAKCRNQWFVVKKSIERAKLGNRDLWSNGIVDDPT